MVMSRQNKRLGIEPLLFNKRVKKQLVLMTFIEKHTNKKPPLYK